MKRKKSITRISKFHFTHYKYFIALTIITLLILLIQSCLFKKSAESKDPIIKKGNNTLVGSTSCKSCHKEIYNNFIETAHNRSSMKPTKENIKGNFNEGENTYFFNAYDGVVMKSLDSGFYQAKFYDSKFVQAHRFDIIVGSGSRGQSYLYWQNDNLFQLPISYYTMEDTWANSPGYPDGIANFGRVINSQCVGCHSSNIDVISENRNGVEEFDKSSIVYGINCEKCHGAGGNHVDLFTNNLGHDGDNLIVNATEFSQQQQLDACAVCHSSNSSTLTPVLEFSTGDTLNHNRLEIDQLAKVDVHGNQYGLLVESKCFTNSINMTCSTCHNPHVDQSIDLLTFSNKCMDCHTPNTESFCKKSKEIESSILQQNCIDCHMPNTESQILNLQLESQEGTTPAVIRSHLIKVHEGKEEKISLMFMKNKSIKSFLN